MRFEYSPLSELILKAGQLIAGLGCLGVIIAAMAGVFRGSFWAYLAAAAAFMQSLALYVVFGRARDIDWDENE